MKKKLMISLALIIVVILGFSFRASACTLLTAEIDAWCESDGADGYVIMGNLKATTDSGAMTANYSLTVSTLPDPTVTGSFLADGNWHSFPPIPVACGTYIISGSVTLPLYNTLPLGPKTVVCECPPDGEGCTPGYAKNHPKAWEPTGLSPDAIFDFTFGVNLFGPEFTLWDAVWARGGGVNKLARHGTAALWSALHPDVNYPLTPDEVIALVQAGDADTLAEYNELGCPLN